MIRDIFLVKSPLQLINALEARHHFGLSGDECLLLNLADRKSRAQMDGMIRHSRTWPHALYVSDLPLFGAEPIAPDATGKFGFRFLRTRTLAFRRLSRLARTLGQVERIFLGDYRNLPMRHLAYVLPHRETILLDDGTATLSIAEFRLKERDQRPKKRLKDYLKMKLLGMRNGELPRLTFFSAYDFQTRPADRLIPNAFNRLRETMMKGRGGEDIFFLGSPLTEVAILDQAMHLAHLAAVRDHFAGERLIYVAHRRETPDWLRRVAELGVEIRHFEFPIEYQIAIVGPRPRILASFISTALGNCRLIFGDSLEIVAFRMQSGSYGKKEGVDGIYHYFETLTGPFFRIESVKIQQVQEGSRPALSHPG